MSPMNHSILVKLQRDQIAVGSLIEKLMDLSKERVKLVRLQLL